MLPYIELAFAWMLFISLPILAAGMFYRARKYYSALAVLAPTSSAPDKERSWQRHSMIINVIGGSALFLVMAAILLYGVSFATWSGIAALVVWFYFVANLLIERTRRAEAASS